MNPKNRFFAASVISCALTLAACSSDDGRVTQTTAPPFDAGQAPPPTTPTLPTPAEPLPPVDLPIMADGPLSAEIRRTTFGVPHIKADSLQELAYGSGYAQAQDHLCILADNYVKVNSRRSMFFGPHASINIATGEIAREDNGNLVSDFGYLATGIRAAAEANIDNIPERTKAALNGFAAGYNKYLSELPSNPTPNLPCAGQPWVTPIEPVDVLTNIYGIAMLPGAANFFDLMFFANPGDGEEYLPRLALGGKPSAAASAALVDIQKRAVAQKARMTMPEANTAGLGSNGWGLGSQMTDNGKGIVLGNPHFPHTGQIRFFQSHQTIPGVMDVTGGSLIGMPAGINIGFNNNVAWTHTFSTAEHFVVYRLGLAPGDRQTYVFDGAAQPITQRTETIMVNVGGGQVLPFEKDIYVTARGPMIEAPPTAAPFGWNDTDAFYIQDANMYNDDVIEHWLSMNLARNLDEFQQAFKDYDGVIFNNTMYADDEGNAWYIDDSTVPGLTRDAENGIRNDPTLAGFRAQAGFTVLPGVSSIFGFTGAEPYENAPKLLTDTYVQNSNDSFWLTNLESPINSYVSPLYGNTHNVQTMRSRMGHRLLKDSAGEDGLFNAAEVEAALFSNRAFFAELVFDELLSMCVADENGELNVPVTDGTQEVNVIPACNILQTWKDNHGGQNVDAVGGGLVREFAYEFCSNSTCTSGLTGAFNPADPLNTPAGIGDGSTALSALATAWFNMSLTGISPDAPLGAIQFTEKSLPNGMPSGAVIPWPGANSHEGGFNVFSYNYDAGRDNTLLPHHSYDRLEKFVGGGNFPSGLTNEGYHVRYGSSWMMVVQFTDEGPQGRGILTFSQSNNFQSEHWNDQSVYYAQNNSLRPILFKEEDIAAEVLTTKTITSE